MQEPLFADGQPFTDGAEAVGVGDADIVEGVAGVAVNDVVHVLGVVDDVDAGAVQVDEKEGVAVAGGGVGGALDDDEIGHVAGGDMPFFAANEPVVAVADGRCFQLAGVRPGVRFGDGIAGVPLAIGRRTDIPFDLFGGGVFEDDGRGPDQPAQAVGRFANLFVDDDLVNPAVFGAADSAGQAAGMDV